MNKIPSKPPSSVFPSKYQQNSNKPPLLATPNHRISSYLPQVIKVPPKPTKYIRTDVRAEKIAKGLCYYCDQKYHINHKSNFKEPQFFTVEIEGTHEGIENLDTEPILTELDADRELVDLDPWISVSARTGIQNLNTMRVIGRVGNIVIHILIDSGSTHNFLDVSKAKQLNYQTETISTQAVTVADGSNIVCQSMCKHFNWEMNHKTFETEILVIALGGCDMVLGVQ